MKGLSLKKQSILYMRLSTSLGSPGSLSVAQLRYLNPRSRCWFWYHTAIRVTCTVCRKAVRARNQILNHPSPPSLVFARCLCHSPEKNQKHDECCERPFTIRHHTGSSVQVSSGSPWVLTAYEVYLCASFPAVVAAISSGCFSPFSNSHQLDACCPGFLCNRLLFPQFTKRGRILPAHGLRDSPRCSVLVACGGTVRAQN